MTDDEAFVRQIVASPGDDTPRLVYADWLDERNDPRGAYLRAEAAHPGDVGRLTPAAAGLDPVWVARVTRPPAGVCCDDLRFSLDGPPATAADLDRLERELGYRLPATHRAFLLNWNGGAPSAVFFRNPARRGSELGTVTRFYGLTVARGGLRLAPAGEHLAAAAGTLYGGRCPPDGPPAFAPLAANEFPYQNLIGLTGVRAGKVYWHNYYALHRADRPRKVADSLPAFLAALRPTADSIPHR